MTDRQEPKRPRVLRPASRRLCKVLQIHFCNNVRGRSTIYVNPGLADGCGRLKVEVSNNKEAGETADKVEFGLILPFQTSGRGLASAACRQWK